MKSCRGSEFHPLKTQSISAQTHHTAPSQTQLEGEVTAGHRNHRVQPGPINGRGKITCGPVPTGETHFQHMVSYGTFGLDEDLVDEGVTMVTVHFMDAVLVVLAQREQHAEGQSLRLLTVTQLHRLGGETKQVQTL